ncbi:hypothetical protein K466DRAFT_593004, partial [Polyporus arcularius HHB13444]
SSSALLRSCRPLRPVSSGRHHRWPQLRVPDVHAQAAVRFRATLSRLIRRRPIARRPASGGD